MCRGAHASRRAGFGVTPNTNFPFLSQWKDERASREVRDREDALEPARGPRALPSPDLNLDRQQMIDHVSAVIGIVQHWLRSAK